MAKSYTPLPPLPSEMAPRYKVILEVLAGELTVSEGARQLGLSRNHFQTLMHRSQQGLLEGLQGRTSGRPPMPEPQRQLKDQVIRLQQENERLRRRVDMTDRLLGVASGLLKGRQSRTRGKMTESPEDE